MCVKRLQCFVVTDRSPRGLHSLHESTVRTAEITPLRLYYYICICLRKCDTTINLLQSSHRLVLVHCSSSASISVQCFQIRRDEWFSPAVMLLCEDVTVRLCVGRRCWWEEWWVDKITAVIYCCFWCAICGYCREKCALESVVKVGLYCLRKARCLCRGHVSLFIYLCTSFSREEWTPTELINAVSEGCPLWLHAGTCVQKIR